MRIKDDMDIVNKDDDEETDEEMDNHYTGAGYKEDQESF